jgi:hypothetical protein
MVRYLTDVRPHSTLPDAAPKLRISAPRPPIND